MGREDRERRWRATGGQEMPAGALATTAQLRVGARIKRNQDPTPTSADGMKDPRGTAR